MTDQTKQPLGPEEFGDFATGLLDALVGFGVALVNAGVLERKDIAAAMTQITEQQKQRDGGPHPAAQFAPEVLRQFFSAEVFRGKPS